MAGNVADIGGVADPRLGAETDAIGSYKLDPNMGAAVRRGSVLYDNSVTFEEYHYYAELEREYENTVQDHTGSTLWSMLLRGFKGGKSKEQATVEHTGDIKAVETAQSGTASDERGLQKSVSDGPSSEKSQERGYVGVTDDEIHTMGRAARTATWGAVFYLITTDILGPFSVPWAISQLGYGPGAALYTVFAAMAAYSGVLLWRIFLGLDSSLYPVKNYGDLGFRLFGKFGSPVRWFFNVLQEFQFFLGVVLLIITTGQSLNQMSVGPHNGKALCFVVCLVIMALAGMILSQIRTLQRLGWAANLAVWLNLLTIFITMGVVAHSAPNWTAVTASYGIPEGPIYHYGNLPPGLSLTDNVNGLMQAVYSYGGATLFCELMAEMKRPWDFWKGLICADILIFCCYLFFGMFVYGYQGQATFNPAYQGVNPYAWQTVANTFQLITGLIAAALYGNIGIKVLYNNVGREFLKFPALETTKGKWIWVVFAPTYWALCFILAAAVPQVSYLGAFVGAAAIMQFSYTFPPMLSIAYNIRKDTLGEFDPATGQVTHKVTGLKRYISGYLKQPLLNGFNTIYFLGAVVTAILGLYSSGVGMHKQFMESTGVSSFSCKSPTG